MEANLLPINEITKKRRLISREEFENDMSFFLEKLSHVFIQTKKDYNTNLNFYPPECRVRNLEASFLNASFIKSFNEHFPNNGRFGKYKRFIINLNGYILLFKKLNNKNMPMNVLTKNVNSINSQLSLNLFGDLDFGNEPIIYLGYKKDRFGMIGNLTFVYIDENKIKWMLDLNDNDFESDNFIVNVPVSGDPTPRLKTNLNIKKAQ